MILIFKHYFVDFSTKTILDLLIYSEITAAITATIFYFKYKESPVKFILMFLWLIVFNEQMGDYMGRNKIWLYQDNYNYWIYNVIRPFKTLLIFFIYFKTLKTKMYVLWIKRFMIIYCIIYPINILFIQDFFTNIQSNTMVLGALFTVICTIFYFIELLRSEKIIVFHKQLLFWISIGLLIFYSGTIPLILAHEYYAHFNYIHSIFLIIYILGIVMYLLFSFGFIWSRKE